MAFENIQMVDLPATSHVAQAGYDPVARVLIVRYRKGGGGVYHGATEEDFQALVTADSPGKYIHSTMKHKYGYEPI